MLNEKHDANNNQQLRYEQWASWLLVLLRLLVEYTSGFTRTGHENERISFMYQVQYRAVNGCL